MKPSAILISLGFFVVTSLLFVGVTLYLAKRARRGRYPINKDIQLLRQPGESLREKLANLDERLFEEIARGLFVPLLVFAAPILVLNWIKVAEPHLLVVIGVVLLGYLVSLGYRIRRVLKLIAERKNQHLGYVGERVVADALEPLKRKGFHVFHDVPAQGATGPFNLDHVIVGPTGLFCIETKTRRKYESKAGGDDYKVGFDGEAVIWPNGRDTESVKQARDGVRWLESTIRQRLGRKVAVTPFLAIPGWYTDETLHSDLRVLSQKRLVAHLSQKGHLDPETVDLVARQLDVLCRNVPCEG